MMGDDMSEEGGDEERGVCTLPRVNRDLCYMCYMTVKPLV